MKVQEARLTAASGQAYDRENRYELTFSFEAKLDSGTTKLGTWRLFNPASQVRLVSQQPPITAETWHLQHTNAGMTIPLHLAPGETRVLDLPLPAATTFDRTGVVPVLVEGRLCSLVKKRLQAPNTWNS